MTDRCERLGSDVFATRLMLRPAFCAVGEEAAEVFYEPGRFTRRKAIPPTTLMLLQDRGSVQTLDGEAHGHRKQLFMSLMRPEKIAELSSVYAQVWRSRLSGRSANEDFVLHDFAQEMLCRAGCAWAGIFLSEDDVAKRTKEFAAMIDGAGSPGPRSWKGLILRSRTERWAKQLIEAVRSGELEVEEDRALHIAAWHRELDGQLLDVDVAAVELINFLRPIVAVARYVMFIGLALHEHPEEAGRLRESGGGRLQAFIHEVRRYYPFFPMVGGRALLPFEWRGQSFEKGAWFLLDLYGTNRDARSWDSPEEFRSDRFLGRSPTPFDLIPQGGGEHFAGHRCAGEWLTIELMKKSAEMLAKDISYEVPPQDLSIDLSRMPAQPRSRFRITNVRREPG